MKHISYNLSLLIVVEGLFGCGSQHVDNGASLAAKELRLELGANGVSLAVGEATQLYAVPTLADGSPATGLYVMSWESSNTAVVAVDGGNLQALAVGTAEIRATATLLDGGASSSDSILVTVLAEGTTPSCGDSVCAEAETCDSCAADCGSCPVEPICTSSAGSWQNVDLGGQTGLFSLEFDATPSAAGIDAVAGLSNGVADAYTDLGAIVRFNTGNTIDARNGSAYQAATSASYSAGVSYHFRLVVDLTARKYSAFVSAPGGAEITIANNFAFRTEQSSVSSFANLGVYATSNGSGVQICDVTVNGASSACGDSVCNLSESCSSCASDCGACVAADTTAPTVSITSPGTLTNYASAITAMINASASDNVGVTMVEFYDGTTLKDTDTSAPYSFAWSFTSANNGTHVWTAKAYDAAGNSAVSSSVSVTVNISTTTTESTELYFQTDFEGTSVSGERLLGVTLDPYIDGLFFNNLTANINSTGARAYAFQEVRQDPFGNGGSVLYAQTLNDDPNSSGTSRAQMSINFQDRHLGVYHTSHRIYLSPDIQALEQYPERNTWFTLFEIWNQSGWSSGDPAGSARWSLDLCKARGENQPLYWGLTAEYRQPSAMKDIDMWGSGTGYADGTKTNFAVPVSDYLGHWVTLDMYMKRGEGSDGRMLITLTRDGDDPVVLFDINDTTIYPGRPELGLGGYTPFKLYTSDTVLDWMSARGKKIAAYYDDFTWYKE